MANNNNSPQNIYNKPALSTEELIDFLIAKGLCVPSRKKLEHAMKYYGYYRLKIFMRSFEGVNKRFLPNIQIDDIIKLYNSDRDLRLLIIDGVERVEIALRSQIILHLTKNIGAHGYMDNNLYKRKYSNDEFKKTFLETRSLANDYYRENYDNPKHPPLWVALEGASFGTVSKIFSSLETKYRKEIAKAFGLDEKICVSWFKSLVTIRNISAHHGRIWNDRLSLRVNQPILMTNIRQLPSSFSRQLWDKQDSNKIYPRLLILRILLERICPNEASAWVGKVKSFIQNRPNIMSNTEMGFPQNWHTLPEWQ